MKNESGARPTPDQGAIRTISTAVSPGRRGRSPVLAILLLSVITLGALSPITGNDFVGFDDDDYLAANPVVMRGLTLPGIAWAATTFHAANWHPLTWMSHMLDVSLFGLRPGWHHGMSLLLHLAATLLLFLVMRQLTGRPGASFFASALFAVHPLRVESVAWAAERKDVLAGLFWMLSLLAYVRYVTKPAPGRYLLLCGALAAGLAAKPMLVTLPFVLILLDWWPLGRSRDPAARLRLLAEKVPLLVLAGLSSLLTLWAQRAGHAMASWQGLPMQSRAANAVAALGEYLLKIFWPLRLSPYYPFPAGGVPSWKVAAAALALLVVTAIVVRVAPRFPFVPVGWFWYLGTLVPVLGLVQVGAQAMADRYAYLPSIGVFLVVAMSSSELRHRVPSSSAALTAVAALCLGLLSVLTFLQSARWQNSGTLFGYALRVDPGNWFASNNLGVWLADRGRLQEAKASYVNAISVQPDFPQAHLNLGNVLMSEGRIEEAFRHFREAARLDPADAHVPYAQGLLMEKVGNFREAEAFYRKAIQLSPQMSQAHNNLAVLLLSRPGRAGEALEHLRQAVAGNPLNASAIYNLGALSEAMGKRDEAIGHFRRVLGIDPAYPDAREHLEALLRRRH